MPDNFKVPLMGFEKKESKKERMLDMLINGNVIK
jgi:hypothetical protein